MVAQNVETVHRLTHPVRDPRAGYRRTLDVLAAAKAYRLLRAVLATAADDRVIPRTPCRIRGAGDEKPAERPVLTVAQVFDLATG